MTKQNEELQSIVKRQIEARQQFMRDAQKLRADRPQLPKQQDIPSAPTQHYRNPFEAFSSPAVMLGMLASLFTRQPLTVAFNSAAAALKGYHEGDKEVFDQETANWKRNVDVALKQNQKELDVYNAAWNQHKENFHDMLSEFEARAAGFKDEQMLTLLKYAGPKEIWEMLQHRIEAQQKVEEGRLRVEKEKAEIEKLHVQADQIRTGGVDDDQINEFVQRRLQGDRSFEAGIKRGYQGQANWMRYQAALNQAMEEKGISGSDLVRIDQSTSAQGKALSRSLGAFAVGPQGNSIRSFDVAVSHLKLLRDLSTALKNGDVNLWNSTRLAFQSEFGSAAPTNFDGVRQIVGDEVVKAVIGSGSGALGDRQEIAANLNKSRSPAQLEGLIDNYLRLMVGQLHGLSRQYERTTGLKDFDSILSDDTKAEFSRVGATPGTAPTKSSGAPFVVPPGFSAVEIDAKGKPVTPAEPTQKDEDVPAMVPGVPGVGGF